MKDFQNLLTLLEIFGQDEEAEQLIQNPLFKFFEQTEQIQARIRLSPLSKMVNLYESGVGQ